MSGKGIESLIERIFQLNNGLLFWEIHNTVGQNWILPQKHIKQFLSLFQPSSIEGKIVAKILPYLCFTPFLASKINARPIKLELNSAIKNTICKSFAISDFEYGIFCGSPGKHQKITMMINQDKKSLGYCKITDRPEVFSIFQKESMNLSYLRSKGMHNIPKILFVDEIPELQGVFLLVQTTNRDGVIRSATIDDICVFDFVLRMHNLTKCKMNYVESDFFQSINILKNYLYLFQFDEQKNILGTINKIEERLAQPSYYSAYHGDFTPWNSYIINKELFVFDFEYFQKYTVPYLDYFHFFTQVCIYNKYMNTNAIFDRYLTNREMIQGQILNPDFYYICYLLTIMAFYLKRDNGFLNERIESCFKIWIGLIKKINYEFFV